MLNDITYDFPNGPVNLAPFFPAINWKLINQYYVTLYDDQDVAVMTTPVNHVTNEWTAVAIVRLHFLNYSGRYDSITFSTFSKVDEVKSDNWTKPLAYPLKKTDGGLQRNNVRARNSFSVKTDLYKEDAQKWLEQLLESPMVFMELPAAEGQAADYMPVVIGDKTFTTRKEEERFIYETAIDFRVANEKIGLRV